MPRVDFGRNQFGGARSAVIKVLRATGFDEKVVAEEDVGLGG